MTRADVIRVNAPDILVRPGIPAPLRDRPSAFFFEAFEDKLGSILGRGARGARLMARLMRPAATLSTRSPWRRRCGARASAAT